MRTWLRSKALLFLALAVLLAIPAVALADVLNTNVVEIEGAETRYVKPGVSTTVSYFIQQQSASQEGTGGLNNCNADSTTPAVVTLTVPSGVTVSGATLQTGNKLTFTACNAGANAQDLTFSSNTEGTYNITASVSDAGPGVYTNSADWKLVVDNTAPSVSSTDPANNATGVAVDKDFIKATFNEKVDPATISGSTFSLTGPSGAVGATVTYDAATQTAKLDPTSNLAQDTTYTARLEGGATGTVVKDYAGNALASDYTWSFKTFNPNTAPVVFVTGVKIGSYEIGSEPTPGCSVTDTEDGLSGSTTAATPQVDRSALSHGLGVVTVTCSYTDGGSITRSATSSYTVVDTTDPTASHQLSTPANGNGWHKADFTVTLNGSDTGGSGVKELHYTVNNGTEQVAAGASKVLNINTEGVQDISFYSVDWAGNDSTADSFTVRLDKTNPTIDVASRTPTANSFGWNNTSVTVSFTCGDTGGSDVDTCTAPITLANQGAGQSATGNVADKAGNTASVTESNINIDKTAPTLNPSVSPNPVVLNGSATASPNASDALSTIASASCNTVDTSTAGPHSVSCSATDKAGNPASAAASYNVGFNFAGFAAPVDNDHYLNVLKAGQAIPLKWRLLDANNNPVTNLQSASISVKSLSCTTGSTDLMEEVAAGASSLQNLGNGYYQYNWKSPTSYANSCRTLQLDLGEGTPRTADFKFTK